jgi:hypothetical protein
MTRTPDSERVMVEFFDDQQSTSKYDRLKARTKFIDQAAGAFLNDNIRGNVLCVGGVWDFFTWRRPAVESMTVVDLSQKMLDAYSPEGSTKVLGDFYQCDFAAGQFDSIVMPLILHHVAEGDGSTWGFVQKRITDAFALAQRWTKPGGRVFVMEYCPHRAWMPLQSALVPVTKRFLRVLGQPLVAMHNKEFYLDSLRQASFEPTAMALETTGFAWHSFFPLFMATPWLQVPFAVFPKPHIFIGVRSNRLDD